MSKRQSKPTINPVEFIDRVIKHDEKGEPFTLAPYQRRVLEMALRRDPSGELVFRLVVLSEPKKSGKTFMAACLALWWAVTNPHTEIILVANDEEQATGRVFKTAVDLIERNSALEGECEVYTGQIRMNNGTTVTPISSDFKGAAGSRHSLCIFDEIWAFGAEKARRLYEELTPPPSEASAWLLIVTYAGFLGESDLLESIYQRGLSGRRVDTGARAAPRARPRSVDLCRARPLRAPRRRGAVAPPERAAAETRRGSARPQPAARYGPEPPAAGAVHVR